MAMADWQQYTQSVVLGLIFSFILAKLFSVIFAFRDENVQVTSTNPNTNENKSDVIPAPEEKDELVNVNWKKLDDSDVNENADDDDDDDWEGVECTELDEAFSAATAFVAATAADRSSVKASTDLQLKLYGLYKIATEGPCSLPQPSAIKMTARAKWKAWHKLGAMPPEEAMQEYLQIITELYPTWADGSTYKRDGDSNEPSGRDTRPMGPVFSSFIHTEESGDEQKLDAIHDFAREGDVQNLLKCLEGGISVDTKDSEGRTPLHWAVDRGHTDVAELLLSKNADVNIKDNEGQTPLHYAAVCEREAIAELLVKASAGISIKDDDGNYPSDLSSSNWPWIQP
ncbi:acyl-CoA-binding domain-containing protein 1-like isoform X2 [Rutidosis leptorrhynchoides]|uniref:acyl-CoA-binding domain-containing protein 1-like isoform X2 n=1 Tax=Rutidosis leptorrhynchoides TaxID=125765 RepID=UPI003A9A0A7E